MGLGLKKDKSGLAQEEFHFYLEDAKSRLLLVPASGNAKAEEAAKRLKVPVATLALPVSKGLPHSWSVPLLLWLRAK